MVGKRGDDNVLAVVAGLLELGLRLHDDAAAARGVSIHDALTPADFGPRGEVRACDVAHQPFGGGLRVVYQVNHGVADFAQVVGRNVGGHTHGDAGGAVDEHIGKAGGQHRGLGQRIVEVGSEVHGVLVNVGQQLVGHRRQAGLGVSHGRRRVPVDAAEVSLPRNKRVTHGEVLRQPYQSVVD